MVPPYSPDREQRMAETFFRGGRKPGSVNRTQQRTANLIIAVFEGLGGVPAMIKWVEENPAHKVLFYTHILPKCLRSSATPVNLIGEVHNSQTLQISAVQVADPREALSKLEQLEDARYAADAARGDGDERAVDGSLPSYEGGVQSADGGSAGDIEAEGNPDAASPREDDHDGAAFPVPVLHDVSAP